MILRINGEPTEFEAYSLGYDNDLLDGVLLDMPQTYVYLSDHVEAHRDMQADLPDDIEHFNFSGCEIDWEEEPFCHIAKAVGRLIVQSAEECLE